MGNTKTTKNMDESVPLDTLKCAECNNDFARSLWRRKSSKHNNSFCSPEIKTWGNSLLGGKVDIRN